MGQEFLVVSCGLIRGNNYFAYLGGNSQTVHDFTFYIISTAKNGEYSLYSESKRLMFVSKANWFKFNGTRSGCGFSIDGNFKEYNDENSACFEYSTLDYIPSEASALLGLSDFYSAPRPTSGWNNYACRVSVAKSFITLYKRYCQNAIGGSVAVKSSENNTSGDGVYWNVTGDIVFTVTPDENYVFKGFVDPNGNVVYSSPTLSISNIDYKDYELTPVFHALYTVAYNANGGEGEMPAHTAEQKVSFDLERCVFTRMGYVFTGWNTKADGTGVSYTDSETVSDLTDEAGGVVTLYAQWRKVVFELTTSVHIPDGMPVQSPNVTVSAETTNGLIREGSEVSITAQAEDLEGIKFDSWNVEGISVSDISANPLSFSMPSNDVSVTAVYVLRKLEVNHSVDSFSQVAIDGETSITDKDGNAADELYYGTEVVFHAPDSTEGYYFSGWYNGNERVSQNRNYTVVLTGDISLLARYSTDVTVSKNEDGGTGYISVDGVGYEGSENVLLRKELGASMQIVAVATSGAFGGWYDGAAILELFRDDTVVITGKSTYTARFIAEAVTVQVTCQSVKNSDTDDGALGTLALAGPGVTDNGNGSYSVEGFTEVVLTATQADGGLPLFRVVEEMSGVESAIDISKPIRILSSDRTFIARWGSKGKFQVAVSSADNAAGIAYIGESAAVTSLTGEQDSIVTITALPSNGYRFVGWYDGDILVSEKARYSFALVEPVSLQARFAEDAAAICVWEGSGENKRLSWKSKVFVMPRPFDPVAARVDAVGYPVSLSVGTYSSPDAVPTRDHAVQVQNQSGRRLPRMRSERFLRISVESEHEVDSVVVATNLVEVN